MKKNLLKSLSMMVVAIGVVTIVNLVTGVDIFAITTPTDFCGVHGLTEAEAKAIVEDDLQYNAYDLYEITTLDKDGPCNLTLNEQWPEYCYWLCSQHNIIYKWRNKYNYTWTVGQTPDVNCVRISHEGKTYCPYCEWGTPPTPDPDPTPTPTPCEPEKKPAKKNIEITPYMISVINEILNKNKAQNAVAVDVPKDVVVDKDTCKSEVPHNTAGVSNTNSKIGDLKVHTVNAATENNQKFLADNFASQQGKRARILVNASVHPRRDLGADNGIKEVLTWANLEKVAQPVYAVCYNQTDKAYYISGLLDSNGVAKLNDFILRDATNVTIFVLE